MLLLEEIIARMRSSSSLFSFIMRALPKLYTLISCVERTRFFSSNWSRSISSLGQIYSMFASPCLGISFFACNDIICVGNFDRAFGLLTAAKHIFTIGTHSELISRRINNVVLHHVGADRGHTVGRRQRLLLYHTSAGWLAIDIVNIKAAFFTPRH